MLYLPVGASLPAERRRQPVGSARERAALPAAIHSRYYGVVNSSIASPAMGVTVRGTE
jgi:hypothetical protein